jgi:lysophospholipase L1-like esterase
VPPEPELPHALIDPSAIKAWGDSNYGGTGAPSGNNYIKIYSTLSTFAALKADGSIKAWGSSGSGGTGAPSGSRASSI